MNNCIIPEKYKIECADGEYVMMGGITDSQSSVETEAHFQNIQSQIIAELNKARVSIIVVMAWFPNKILAEKLIEKYREGLDVKVTIYDDGINRKHGVELAGIDVKKI